MARFFVTAIEQMDLALDQLSNADLNYQRFALMLVDNVVELALHRHATTAKYLQRLKVSEERFRNLSKDARGPQFPPKVELATLTGLLQESEAGSIRILHSFRNQAYHQGLVDNTALPALASFYFDLACDLLIKTPHADCTFRAAEALPLRVTKHVGNIGIEGIPAESPTVFARLKSAADSLSADYRVLLLSDWENVINYTDANLVDLKDYTQEPRDEITKAILATDLLDSPEAEEFLRANTDGSLTATECICFLQNHYNLPHKTDPIPSYRKRHDQAKTETCPHRLLLRYRDFMVQTRPFREAAENYLAMYDNAESDPRADVGPDDDPPFLSATSRISE